MAMQLVPRSGSTLSADSEQETAIKAKYKAVQEYYTALDAFLSQIIESIYSQPGEELEQSFRKNLLQAHWQDCEVFWENLRRWSLTERAVSPAELKAAEQTLDDISPEQLQQDYLKRCLPLLQQLAALYGVPAVELQQKLKLDADSASARAIEAAIPQGAEVNALITDTEIGVATVEDEVRSQARAIEQHTDAMNQLSQLVTTIREHALSPFDFWHDQTDAEVGAQPEKKLVQRAWREARDIHQAVCTELGLFIGALDSSKLQPRFNQLVNSFDQDYLAANQVMDSVNQTLKLLTRALTLINDVYQASTEPDIFKLSVKAITKHAIKQMQRLKQPFIYPDQLLLGRMEDIYWQARDEILRAYRQTRRQEHQDSPYARYSQFVQEKPIESKTLARLQHRCKLSNKRLDNPAEWSEQVAAYTSSGRRSQDIDEMGLQEQIALERIQDYYERLAKQFANSETGLGRQPCPWLIDWLNHLPYQQHLLQQSSIDISKDGELKLSEIDFNGLRKDMSAEKFSWIYNLDYQQGVFEELLSLQVSAIKPDNFYKANVDYFISHFRNHELRQFLREVLYSKANKERHADIFAAVDQHLQDHPQSIQKPNQKTNAFTAKELSRLLEDMFTAEVETTCQLDFKLSDEIVDKINDCQPDVYKGKLVIRAALPADVLPRPDLKAKEQYQSRWFRTGFFSAHEEAKIAAPSDDVKQAIAAEFKAAINIFKICLQDPNVEDCDVDTMVKRFHIGVDDSLVNFNLLFQYAAALRIRHRYSERHGDDLLHDSEKARYLQAVSFLDRYDSDPAKPEFLEYLASDRRGIDLKVLHAKFYQYNSTLLNDPYIATTLKTGSIYQGFNARYQDFVKACSRSSMDELACFLQYGVAADALTEAKTDALREALVDQKAQTTWYLEKLHAALTPEQVEAWRQQLQSGTDAEKQQIKNAMVEKADQLIKDMCDNWEKAPAERRAEYAKLPGLLETAEIFELTEESAKAEKALTEHKDLPSLRTDEQQASNKARLRQESAVLEKFTESFKPANNDYQFDASQSSVPVVAKQMGVKLDWQHKDKDFTLDLKWLRKSKHQVNAASLQARIYAELDQQMQGALPQAGESRIIYVSNGPRKTRQKLVRMLSAMGYTVGGWTYSDQDHKAIAKMQSDRAKKVVKWQKQQIEQLEKDNTPEAKAKQAKLAQKALDKQAKQEEKQQQKAEKKLRQTKGTYGNQGRYRSLSDASDSSDTSDSNYSSDPDNMRGPGNAGGTGSIL